jgi:hypothetical protein
VEAAVGEHVDRRLEDLLTAGVGGGELSGGGGHEV